MVTKSLFRFACLCIFLFSCSALLSQDKNADAAAAQKAWMDYMTPGQAHKMMAESEGEWKSKMKVWMDPAGDPMLVEGSNTNEMILGGRFMKSVHHSSMMGMPFEGWSIMGVDNITHEITAVWIDNTGTGTSIGKGTYDKSTNTITLNGTSMNPMSGKEEPFRQTFKFVDKDNQIMEYFVLKDDKEIKVMEATYWRDKK